MLSFKPSLLHLLREGLWSLFIKHNQCHLHILPLTCFCNSSLVLTFLLSLTSSEVHLLKEGFYGFPLSNTASATSNVTSQADYPSHHQCSTSCCLLPHLKYVCQEMDSLLFPNKCNQCCFQGLLPSCFHVPTQELTSMLSFTTSHLCLQRCNLW